MVTDAAGQPLYSGRVLLLPYLEQAAIYNAFAKDQPWDSPTNLPLSQTTISLFADPSAPKQQPGQNDYLFVTGTGTIFEAGQASSLARSGTARRTRSSSSRPGESAAVGPSPRISI